MAVFSNFILFLLLWGTARIDTATGDDRTLARRAMPMTSKGAMGKGMKGKGKMKPTRKPTKRVPPPTAPRQSKAFFASQSSTDLEVVNCTKSTVEIGGNQAGNVTAGTYFLYLQDGDVGCAVCSPLYRYVASVQKSSKGTFVLSTRFATAGEILGDRAGSGIKNAPLEPLAGCSHSGSTTRALVSDENPPLPNDGTCDTEPCQSFDVPAPQATQGSCADSWLQKNSDGRCTYTNCFVGTNGSPNDCFKCKRLCDNGCGASGSVLNTDGNFGLFDFGPACCNHDYCWSSTVSEGDCNSNFFDQMVDQCPPLGLVVVALFLPLPLQVPLASCHVLATSFFLAVSSPIGENAYKQAQIEQKTHEKEPVCVAKCPSTQTSGGQGTTVLTIDLIVRNGTFPVSYEMYSIPDQLFIDYEGQRIFDTGGLVSGSGSADVTYSGTSTTIQVTINAPNSGTAWDVFIGCPYGLSP
jgi:hypothetical protein